MKKIYFYLFVFLFLFSFSVNAKSIDHFYAEADGNVTMKDDVKGSSFLAGDSIEQTGIINGASIIAGNNIDFSGTSDYSVIAGNTINVDGIVEKDTVIAGNIINIKKQANLQRDAIIFGSDIEVKGTIGRNVTIYARKISFVGANILGNVRTYAEEISADSETAISGKLSYPKDAQANISPNIINIEKTDPIQTDDKEELKENIINKIWSYMSIILIFAILTLACPKIFEKINKEYEELKFGKAIETFSKGLVFLIMVPVICFMLLMLPFGLPLSLILFALYFIIIYLAKLFFGYLIGYKIWQKFMKKDINILLVGLLGYVILLLTDFIPVVGTIVKFICLFIGIGIATSLFNKKEA